MFFNFFKPEEECFICYSTANTEEEKVLEACYNIKFKYPLISMKNAYGCECKNYYAHNKCLLDINKCPICRKETKPNLYVKTYYDYYLKYLLDWLKKDTSNIEKLSWCICICYFVIMFYLLYLLDKYDLFEENSENELSRLCIAIICAIFIHYPHYFIIDIKSYTQTYWLYDKEINKYRVFDD